jgi:2-oxoglutarate dehydrogenase E1 component
MRLIPDAREDVERVLLCSGKIYYDLIEAREKLEREDVAILRLEQLYPLPDEVLALGLDPFPDDTPVIWVQEEPENMGASRYLCCRYGDRLLGRFPFSRISRPATASPASGSGAAHRKEQESLLERAFQSAEKQE